MSRSFFFDTSALIKLYHQEIGTERVDEIFRQAGNPIIISELANVELLKHLIVRAREEMVFVCADARLLDIGKLEGLEVLNPETPPASQ